MANWTNIPTDRIEPGKPIRAIDGLALRDNPIAIAEGANGAPKIREAAISTNSINGNRLRTNSVPNDRLTNNSITGSKIASNTVTSTNLAEGNSERDWVGRRIASMSAGAVGTYAFVVPTANNTAVWNQTISGSRLRYSNSKTENSGTTGQLSGTWRILSSEVRAATNDFKAGLAVRIS